MRSISWLHLTDLHFNTDPNAGIASQGWLWPNMREEFFKDLERVYAHTGLGSRVLHRRPGTVRHRRGLPRAR